VSSSSSARTRSAASQENASAPLLDLQLRKDSSAAAVPGRAPFTAHFGDHTGDPMPHSVFGAAEAEFSVKSAPEAWVHRVRREGVPIVRLWNSKAALLSIGLNQRGKPGLWLIQKVP
jgi:hypothetical protein